MLCGCAWRIQSRVVSQTVKATCNFLPRFSPGWYPPFPRAKTQRETGLGQLCRTPQNLSMSPGLTQFLKMSLRVVAIGEGASRGPRYHAAAAGRVCLCVRR